MSYNSIIDNVFPSKKGTTPQNTALPGQIANNAGGYYYPVDEWQMLNRFLILGTEAGTYYVNPVKLTKGNTKVLQKLLKEDHARVINQIVKISLEGRAVKNDSAIFALAIAASSDDSDTKKMALSALPAVCRTGTHLLMFCDLINKMRGWGSSLRKGINRWFKNISADKLALQAIKYYNRYDWTLRDVLRKTHLKPTDAKEKAPLIDWIVHPNNVESISSVTKRFPLIEGKYKVLDILKNKNDLNEITGVIKQYSLPREAVPNKLLNHKEIWDALLSDMPITAMIRNLGKMSQVGLLVPFSDSAKYVANTLLNREALKKGRIHPLQILLALRTYAKGSGEKGSLTWTPVNTIIEALEEAFDLAFESLEPIGKRILVAVDVSASMTQYCSGSSVLTAIEAAAAIATIFVRTDKETHTIGFDYLDYWQSANSVYGFGFKNNGIYEIGLTSKHRLNDVTRCFSAIQGGATDLSLPIKYLLDKRLEVDACILVTDNETWAGHSHAVQELHKYRSQINPAFKLAVLSTAANKGSIIDSNDPLSLDVAGFDANIHYIVSEFIKGNI